MRFGSVCSGIEAASVAWHPLGWEAAWLAEIEPFPSAVLAHHYPAVPNYGDMTALPALIRSGKVEAPDVFCGGTPCQAFSVAGLRKSLGDARGNLSLTFCEIADAIDHVRGARGEPASIVFWENVPGVLSTKDNAFGCFLAGLAGEDDPLQPPGGKWENAGCVFGPERAVAWRILDAQYFGVAQRRRRVFVVASARDGFDPAAVLFEWDGLRRDTAPSREAGQKVANALTDRADRGGTNSEGQRLIAFGGNNTAGPIELAAALNANRGCHNPGDFEAGTLLVGAICAHSFIGGVGGRPEGAAQGHFVPVAFHPTQDPISSADVCHSIGTGNGQGCATAAVVAPALTASNDPSRSPQSSEVTQQVSAVLQASMQVRRLTPVECERLQGFPDDYTAIPWRKKPASECPDGPRYKALGNSWAVPVVRWIGQRIQKGAFHASK